MALTPTGRNKLLDTIVGVCGTLALSTSAPQADGSGITEPNPAYGYARVSIGSVMSAAVNGTKTNETLLLLGETTGDWGHITHYVLYSGSTPVLYGPLVAAVDIPSGYVPLFRVGSITFSIAA